MLLQRILTHSPSHTSSSLSCYMTSKHFSKKWIFYIKSEHTDKLWSKLENWFFFSYLWRLLSVFSVSCYFNRSSESNCFFPLCVSESSGSRRSRRRFQWRRWLRGGHSQEETSGQRKSEWSHRLQLLGCTEMQFNHIKHTLVMHKPFSSLYIYIHKFWDSGTSVTSPQWMFEMKHVTKCRFAAL